MKINNLSEYQSGHVPALDRLHFANFGAGVPALMVHRGRISESVSGGKMKLRFLAIAFAVTSLMVGAQAQVLHHSLTGDPIIYEQDPNFNAADSSQNDTRQLRQFCYRVRQLYVEYYFERQRRRVCWARTSILPSRGQSPVSRLTSIQAAPSTLTAALCCKRTISTALPGKASWATTTLAIPPTFTE